MDPAEVIARCDENTIGVVPTLGVTFTGQYEPVEAVSKALDALQQEKGGTSPFMIPAIAQRLALLNIAKAGFWTGGRNAKSN